MHLFLRAWGVTCGWLLLPGWWLSVRRSQIPNRPWASLVSVFQNPSMVCVEVVVHLHFQYIYTVFTFTFPYIKWFPHWREQIFQYPAGVFFFFFLPCLFSPTMACEQCDFLLLTMLCPDPPQISVPRQEDGAGGLLQAVVAPVLYLLFVRQVYINKSKLSLTKGNLCQTVYLSQAPC